MAQVFSLAEVYGQIDRHKESQIRQEAGKMANESARMAQDEEIMVRDTARQAVDPQTGEYSPELHVKNLERAGRPELAYKYRRQIADDSRKVVDWLHNSLPYVNEKTYPKIRKLAADSGIELPEQYNKEEFDEIAQNILTRSKELVTWGDPEQVPGTEKGTIGQKNQSTGKYDILDYAGPGRFGGRSGGGGGSGTGRERIIERIMDDMGVPFAVALELERRSQSMDPAKFYSDVALVSMRQYDTLERAQQKALAITQALYPGWQPGQNYGPREQPPAAPTPTVDPSDPLGLRRRTRPQPPP